MSGPWLSGIPTIPTFANEAPKNRAEEVKDRKENDRQEGSAESRRYRRAPI